jgi:Serine protease Clip domain PPAF-2
MLLKIILFVVSVVHLNGQESPNNGQTLQIAANLAPYQVKLITHCTKISGGRRVCSFQFYLQPCGNGGECVPHYLCRENNTVNTDGDYIFDTRFDDDEPDQPACPNILHTCCGATDIVN